MSARWKTIFSIKFSYKIYVMGTQKNRLNETILLSTQNTCLILVRKTYVVGTQKNRLMSTNSQWSKQEACFARATQALLAIDHNTSVTSGECIRCSKCIARAGELGSCQSNFVLFTRLRTDAKL